MQPATLPMDDSMTGVFLRIFRNISAQLIFETFHNAFLVVDETAFICVLAACHYYYLYSNARGNITVRDLYDTLWRYVHSVRFFR